MCAGYLVLAFEQRPPRGDKLLFSPPRCRLGDREQVTMHATPRHCDQ